jgi:hypothetical protein
VQSSSMKGRCNRGGGAVCDERSASFTLVAIDIRRSVGQLLKHWFDAGRPGAWRGVTPARSVADADDGE